MKIIYSTIFLALISCGKSTSKNEHTKDLTSEKVEKIKAERDKFWDSACKAETKKAEKDIAQNKLTYFHYFGMVTSYLSNEEMNQLLAKYNIGNESAPHYCTVRPEFQNCYGHRMHQEIDKRYGKNFIDSLRAIADKEFVENNPNRIFSFEEIDTIPKYPNDISYRDFSNSVQRDFWKSAEYPVGFEYRKQDEYYSSISAEFILSKTGEVSKIDIELTFENKKNYKYSSYFINKTKEFIAKTKWIPAKSSGIAVISKVPLTIFFK